MSFTKFLSFTNKKICELSRWTVLKNTYLCKYTSDRHIMEWVLGGEYIPHHYGDSQAIVQGYFLANLTKPNPVESMRNKKRKLVSFETADGIVVRSYDYSKIVIDLNYILGYSLCPLVDVRIMKKLVSFSNVPLPKILDTLLKFNRRNKIYFHLLLNMISNYNGWINKLDLDMFILDLRNDNDVLIYIKICLMDIKKVCSINHVEEVDSHDMYDESDVKSEDIAYEMIPFGKVDEAGEVENVTFQSSYVRKRTNILVEDYLLNGITRYYKSERNHCSFMYLNEDLYLYIKKGGGDIKRGGPQLSPLTNEILEASKYLIRKFCSHHMIRKFTAGSVEYENIARVFVGSFELLRAEHFIPI